MQTKPEFIFLTQEEVRATGFTIDDAFEAVEECLGLQSAGEVTLPSKVILDLDERRRGRINAMPAYLSGDYEICGMKWIAGFPGNPMKYGIPRAHAFIILNDPNTGVPLAVMDGTYLSAMRTGAASGVGIKHLARPNSEVLCIIGCGLQSRTQFMGALKGCPTIKRVQAYDISEKARLRLCQWISDTYSFEAIPARTAQEAVNGADIVITVTVADEPIVKEAWLKDGWLFVHAGSYQEEEEAVILNADKIFVDNWSEVKHRGTPLLARLHAEGRIEHEDISGELGDVIIGKIAGRRSDEERIYFVPLGLGIEDVAAGSKVLQKAREMNLGKSLSLWDRLVDWMDDSGQR